MFFINSEYSKKNLFLNARKSNQSWSVILSKRKIWISFLIGYLLLFVCAKVVNKTPFVENPIEIKLAFQSSPLAVTILLTLSKVFILAAVYGGSS